MNPKKFYLLFPLLALLTACAAEVPPAEPVPDFPPVEVVSPAPEPEPEPAPAPEPEPEPERDFLTTPLRTVTSLSMEPGSDLAHASSPSVTYRMPGAALLEHDTFYFPLQFTAEAMGVAYEQDGNTVTLRWEDHETQLFLGERRFIVDGVEGERTGEHALFREGLPRVPVDDDFTPIQRGGVVYLPLEFLPVGFRAAYNAFGAEPFPPRAVGFQNETQLDIPDPDDICAVTVFAYRDKALVNGEVTQMPAAPFPGSELLYVPLSFLAEATGTGYERDGDELRLTYGGHVLELKLGSHLWSLDGEAGVSQQTHWWSNDPAEPAYYVPIERDGEVFIPTDFLPYDERLPVCTLRATHYSYYAMVIYETGRDTRSLAGYRLRTIFDELPAERRENMVSQGIVDTEVRSEYDIELYTDGSVYVHVYRLREGWSNEEGMDGQIAAIAVADPEIPTYRGLRVGDSPRRAWELYGMVYAETFSFQFDRPEGPITLIGLHDIYYSGFDLPNHYITGVPEAWMQTPSGIDDTFS